MLKGNMEEYQTTNELFEIMAENNPQNFDILEDKSVTAPDFVILYENTDLGMKSMSSNNEQKKAPNQYVETIVYNDDHDSEDSDICEIYSDEDLHNVFCINNEKTKQHLRNLPLFDNTLNHKFGNVHLKSSNLSEEYKTHFLFNDLYIKKQLKSFHAMSGSNQSDSAVLSTSLLDYICCNHFDDDYNFYMENIINYVQHIIKQLKRISNGDYLTDRVKEKWRDIQNMSDNETNERKNAPLARAKNIRLPIEKVSEHKSMKWDEVIHSEMDVTSLKKMLKKKIVYEIPKILCGSYRLLTKNFKDNIIVSCQKAERQFTHENETQASVDVILKLQCFGAKLMYNNINSVMILNMKTPSIVRTEPLERGLVALKFEDLECDKKEKIKIIELDDNENDISQEKNISKDKINIDKNEEHEMSYINFGLVPFKDIGLPIHRLNIQTPVIEENEDCSAKKKKSPTRVRIKSPYENKSYILDERKRKRLLEIRDRREKKKLAMNENCKITKHKYTKGAIMAQSSNSVTKLSITNKSFYNSIYGQTNIANKHFKNGIKRQNQGNIPNIDIEEYEEGVKRESSITSPDKNGQKYINRSYYLDDADTEIMYLQIKPNNNEDNRNEILTPSTSVLSSDLGANIIDPKYLIDPSTTDLSGTDTTLSLRQNILLEKSTENANKEINCLILTQNKQASVPTNTPKQEGSSQRDKNKKIKPAECRKSIDKIYDLMKKITISPTSLDNEPSKSEVTNNTKNIEITEDTKNVNVQGSDSTNSIKLQLTSSNPSSFGFENKNPVVLAPKKLLNKKVETPITVVPKVIISSRFQNEKINSKNTDKEDKKVRYKISENPLKAISQLLHQFDNVHKTRHKSGKESKMNKDIDNLNLEDNSSRQVGARNASRGEKNTKRTEQVNSRFSKPLSPTKASKFSQQNSKGEKPVNKNKLADIIDEVKEMRGEAVRGPPKRPTRIDSLAQPKKSYIKYHHEDFQNRHNSNLPRSIPKVQKLTNSLPTQDKSVRTNNKNRQRIGTQMSSGIANQLPKTGSSLEKTAKFRRSTNVSTDENEKYHSLPTNRSPHSYSNVNDMPDSLEKKMVVVETYVKNHFGRISPTRNLGEKKVAHKSRVPLIPTDIDVASVTSSPLAEESTTIGNKLHYMINSKITTNTLALTSFTELNESTTKTDDRQGDKVESIENLSKCDATMSTSDFLVDIFEDKNIVTAVACISKEDYNCKTDKEDETKSHNIDVRKYEVKEPNKCNELQKLENALYRQMSSGTFQKRLRIKKLTLTPKQSMQQVFVLQSGDVGSLIVKPTLSQKLDLSNRDPISKFNLLPAVSYDAINFNLPMQVATIGYVFPKYQTLKDRSSTKKSILSNEDCAINLQIKTSKTNECRHKTIQCYKGNNERQNSKLNTDSKVTDTININKVFSREIFDNPKRSIEGPELNNLLTQQKISKKQIEINNDNYESKNISKNYSDNVSNSTSLDILVGLLNEIKKITTCESNLVRCRNKIHTDLESKELKVILNKSAEQENSEQQSVNSIYISSLDNLRHVNSNFSLRSSKTNDHEEKFKDPKDIRTNNKTNYLPLFIDKEVNVQFSSKEIVHKFTDVPSRLFTSTVNRSTDVMKSFITIVKTSSESVCSFSDCQTLHSNSSINKVDILPCINKNKSFISSKSEIEYLSNNKNIENNTNNHLQMSCDNIMRKNNMLKKKLNVEKLVTLTEFDPIIKIKRDVLVTVYSILVLTVFAALVIPDIIFYA